MRSTLLAMIAKLPDYVVGLGRPEVGPQGLRQVKVFADCNFRSFTDDRTDWEEGNGGNVSGKGGV